MTYGKIDFHVVFLVCFCSGISSGTIDTKLKYFETLKSSDIHVITKRSIDLNPTAQLKLVHLSALGRDFSFHMRSSPGVLSHDFKAVLVNGDGTETPFDINSNEFHEGALLDNVNSHVDAYWEEGNLMATITTQADTFTIEPSWRHLPHSTNHSMIIYRGSDVIHHFNQQSHHHRVCGYIRGENISSDQLVGDDEPQEHPERNHRHKRQAATVKNTCGMMVVADYTFHKGVGKSKQHLTASYIIHILRKVDSIYRSTIWNIASGLVGYGIEIKKMLIHTEYTRQRDHYNSENNWDTSPLLEAFSRVISHKQYCLAHLFTFQKFKDGVLGLAYIASHRLHTVGGVCSPLYTKNHFKCSLNSGWSSSMNTNGDHVLTQQANLVTAHEIGHNWGSEHDPGDGDCAPSSFSNGKYIMYPYAVSGYESNNQKFSRCTKQYVSAVLKSKSSKCFHAQSKAFGFCGDGKIDHHKGEQCDAGFSEHPCCLPNCQLRATAKCSPSNDVCCTENCKVASKNTPCRITIGDDGSCEENSFCDGINITCPKPKKKNDTTECLDHGMCKNGSCLSFCAARDRTSCICDNITDACYRCCREGPGKPCKPYSRNPNFILPNGRPCLIGYCKDGMCKKTVKDLVQRFFSIFEIITTSRFVEFMRSNIVGTVILFSLVLWIPSSCIFSYFDKMREIEDERQKRWFSQDNYSYIADEDRSYLRIKKTENYRQRVLPRNLQPTVFSNQFHLDDRETNV